eukprot:scaffold2657_cov368-Pavlova_lutheri.AAC.13
MVASPFLHSLRIESNPCGVEWTRVDAIAASMVASPFLHSLRIESNPRGSRVDSSGCNSHFHGRKSFSSFPSNRVQSSWKTRGSDVEWTRVDATTASMVASPFLHSLRIESNPRGSRVDSSGCNRHFHGRKSFSSFPSNRVQSSWKTRGSGVEWTRVDAIATSMVASPFLLSLRNESNPRGRLVEVEWSGRDSQGGMKKPNSLSSNKPSFLESEVVVAVRCTSDVLVKDAFHPLVFETDRIYVSCASIPHLPIVPYVSVRYQTIKKICLKAYSFHVRIRCNLCKHTCLLFGRSARPCGLPKVNVLCTCTCIEGRREARSLPPRCMDRLFLPPTERQVIESTSTLGLENFKVRSQIKGGHEVLLQLLGHVM